MTYGDVFAGTLERLHHIHYESRDTAISHVENAGHKEPRYTHIYRLPDPIAEHLPSAREVCMGRGYAPAQRLYHACRTAPVDRAVFHLSRAAMAKHIFHVGRRDLWPHAGRHKHLRG